VNNIKYLRVFEVKHCRLLYMLIDYSKISVHDKPNHAFSLVTVLKNISKHVHGEMRYNMHTGVLLQHGNRSEVEIWK
jgi:hypothetical protein